MRVKMKDGMHREAEQQRKDKKLTARCEGAACLDECITTESEQKIHPI